MIVMLVVFSRCCQQLRPNFIELLRNVLLLNVDCFLLSKKQGKGPVTLHTDQSHVINILMKLLDGNLVLFLIEIIIVILIIDFYINIFTGLLFDVEVVVHKVWALDNTVYRKGPMALTQHSWKKRFCLKFSLLVLSWSCVLKKKLCPFVLMCCVTL